MAEFSCPVVEVLSVEDHPNADRLNIVKVLGYTCISNKLEDGSPRYKAGDRVVYIPENAVMPEWLLKKMGFWKDGYGGTLSGSQGNRVKAIRLRGIFSQGILYPCWSSSSIASGWGITGQNEDEYQDVNDGENVAEALGIVKYEPPIPGSMAGQQGFYRPPINASRGSIEIKFDVENIKNYPHLINLGEPVLATEKLHGTLMAIVLTNEIDDQVPDTFSTVGERSSRRITAFVSSKGLIRRGVFLKNTDENKDNVYIRKFNELNKNDKILETFDEVHRNEQTTMFFLGELYGRGIQDLAYDGLAAHQFRVFKVGYMVGAEERYLSRKETEIVCDQFGLPLVPVLDYFDFNYERVAELTGGQSTLGGNIREGIVIEPVIPRLDARIGNVWLKSISEQYLLRKDGTEFT